MSKGLNFTNFLNSSEWTYTHIYMKRVMNGDKMEMGKIHSKVLYGKWVICAGKKKRILSLTESKETGIESVLPQYTKQRLD